MKCPICDGGGRITSLPSGMLIKCTRCHGKGEVEQTNEEWFTNLTTEEKAEVIAEKIRHAQVQYVPTYGTFTNSDWWENWLKEIHHEN